MSDDDVKDRMLAVKVPGEMVRQLDARAKYLRGKLGVNVTRSDVARTLIRDGLKKEKRR